MTRKSVFQKIFPLASTLSLPPSPATAQSNTSTPFNVTTIATSNDSSILQCWQLTNTPNTADIVNNSHIPSYPLGNTTSLSVNLFAPRTDLGPHFAPAVQWVVALSGLAHVTLPNTTAGPTTEAWISGGTYGIVLATDTSDVSRYGHGTAFPGDGETVLLFMPTELGAVPGHEVLYDGPCGWSELVGF